MGFTFIYLFSYIYIYVIYISNIYIYIIYNIIYINAHVFKGFKSTKGGDDYWPSLIWGVEKDPNPLSPSHLDTGKKSPYNPVDMCSWAKNGEKQIHPTKIQKKNMCMPSCSFKKKTNNEQSDPDLDKRKRVGYKDFPHFYQLEWITGWLLGDGPVLLFGVDSGWNTTQLCGDYHKPWNKDPY